MPKLHIRGKRERLFCSSPGKFTSSKGLKDFQEPLMTTRTCDALLLGMLKVRHGETNAHPLDSCHMLPRVTQGYPPCQDCSANWRHHCTLFWVEAGGTPVTLCSDFATASWHDVLNTVHRVSSAEHWMGLRVVRMLRMQSHPLNFFVLDPFLGRWLRTWPRTWPGFTIPGFAFRRGEDLKSSINAVLKSQEGSQVWRRLKWSNLSMFVRSIYLDLPDASCIVLFVPNEPATPKAQGSSAFTLSFLAFRDWLRRKKPPFAKESLRIARQYQK